MVCGGLFTRPTKKDFSETVFISDVIYINAMWYSIYLFWPSVLAVLEVLCDGAYRKHKAFLLL